MNCFGIPESDHQEFSSLPKHIRREVQRWILWLHEIAQEKPALPAIRRVAERNNLKVKTVYRKLRAYEKYDWRGLINRAKFPAEPTPTSSKTFLRFLHALWLANNKNYKSSHLQIVAIWKGGAPIPGYDYLPKKPPFNECPDGWTYCNLRYHIKTFIEKYPEEIISH
jgi:hypothetical protein